jgi:hypothetical protein
MTKITSLAKHWQRLQHDTFQVYYVCFDEKIKKYVIKKRTWRVLRKLLQHIYSAGAVSSLILSTLFRHVYCPNHVVHMESTWKKSIFQPWTLAEICFNSGFNTSLRKGQDEYFQKLLQHINSGLFGYFKVAVQTVWVQGWKNELLPKSALKLVFLKFDTSRIEKLLLLMFNKITLFGGIYVKVMLFKDKNHLR